MNCARDTNAVMAGREGVSKGEEAAGMNTKPNTNTRLKDLGRPEFARAKKNEEKGRKLRTSGGGNEATKKNPKPT